MANCIGHASHTSLQTIVLVKHSNGFIKLGAIIQWIYEKPLARVLAILPVLESQLTQKGAEPRARSIAASGS